MVLFFTGNSINVRKLYRRTKQFYKKLLVIVQRQFSKAQMEVFNFLKIPNCTSLHNYFSELKNVHSIKNNETWFDDLETFCECSYFFSILKAEIIC